jgi:tetratricopeptide (TPR) repeat protein
MPGLGLEKRFVVFFIRCCVTIKPALVFFVMFKQYSRHQLFQHIATALTHQQQGNTDLALAYWEMVLQILPDELRIHNEILTECRRLAQFSDSARHQHKVANLVETYQLQLSEDEHPAFQQAYRAMTQQCSGNTVLALAHWKKALNWLTSEAFIITLAAQDLCWIAHQALRAGNRKYFFQLYEQILDVFPEFLEGYLNLSIMRYQAGYHDKAVALLDRLPAHYQDEFIVLRYRALYGRVTEITQQFGHVPYAAVEDIVMDLRIENTFYPSIVEEYFTTFIEELVSREHRFFEKRRKALEQKAIAKTSKRLAQEGMALGQRVTLAKHAKSDEVYQFLYDNEIRIAEVLLDNPNITHEDVLIMAQTTHVSDILALIARHRKWGTLQSIRMTVLFNPQTLPRDSAKLLELLNINDLARVVYKKSLPAEVRIRAKRRLQHLFNQLSATEKIAVVEGSAGNIFKLLEDIEGNLYAFLRVLLRKFADFPEIIANISRWKRAPATILTQIGDTPNFTANMHIKFALLSNPRTPPTIVAKLLQRLPKKDIQHLLANIHIPASVKQCIANQFPNLTV